MKKSISYTLTSQIKSENGSLTVYTRSKIPIPNLLGSCYSHKLTWLRVQTTESQTLWRPGQHQNDNQNNIAALLYRKYLFRRVLLSLFLYVYTLRIATSYCDDTSDDKIYDDKNSINRKKYISRGGNAYKKLNHFSNVSRRL